MKLKIIKTLIYSNVYISLLAILMVYRTNLIFNLHSAIHLYLIVFFSTMLTYSFHGIAAEEKIETERKLWNMNKKSLFIFLSMLSVMIIFLLIFKNPFYVKYLLPAGIFTLYYTISRVEKKYSIVKKGYFKTLNLTFVWVYVTSLLPILAAERNLFSGDVLSFILMELVYVYLICFFFEHRDRLNDPQSFIFFNPHLQPQGILVLSTLFFITAIFFAFSFGVENAYIFSKLILFFILLIFSRTSLKSKDECWFYFYLDGMMALDLIGVVIFKQIS